MNALQLNIKTKTFQIIKVSGKGCTVPSYYLETLFIGNQSTYLGS